MPRCVHGMWDGTCAICLNLVRPESYVEDYNQAPSLAEIVRDVLKMLSKWRPRSMDAEEMQQVAWLAALEATEETIDPEEIKRIVQNAVQRTFRRERHRRLRETPVRSIERVQSFGILRERGMSRARAEQYLRETETGSDD